MNQQKHLLLSLLSKLFICFPSCQNAYRLYSAPRNKFSGFRHTLHSAMKRNMKMLHIVQKHYSYKLINSAKHPSWPFDKIILFSIFFLGSNVEELWWLIRKCSSGTTTLENFTSSLWAQISSFIKSRYVPKSAGL